MYKKQTNTKIKKTFLILHYSTLKSTVGQYSSWHAGSGIKCTGKKSSWIEEQEEMGDGRVPLSSIQLCCLDAKLHLTLATPWTVAHQAPLSMGFSTQEYCSELPFPSAGDLPRPGIKLLSSALAGGFLTKGPPGKPVLCGTQSTVHKSTTTLRGCMHMTPDTRHVN